MPKFINFPVAAWPLKVAHERIPLGYGHTCSAPMPTQTDDDQEELVFLSPDEEFSSEPASSQDQGASPQLRRSTRKRKSTAGGNEDMSKGSSSKKKKNSPPKMPKVPRSPAQSQTQAPPQQGQAPQGQSFEALLLAMEGRLTAKIERASEASKEAALQAKLNSEGLEQLESRVDANENCLMAALKETERRIMTNVQDHVQEIVQEKVTDMVKEQLTAAGFDPDLTAGDMSLRRSAMVSVTQQNESYAGVLAAGTNNNGAAVTVNGIAEQKRNDSREEKRQARFHVARRSLRLWPIAGGSNEALVEYMRTKLRLTKDFVDEELGQVTLIKPKEPRNKNKDEYIAVFESKQIRDAVKASAANLANFRDSAGMRLDIPDHLQRDFHALMNLSYDLKKRHASLKRNIKFDEDDYGLYMDLKLDDDSDWKRVKPALAEAANKKRRVARTKDLDEDELKNLLGDGTE